jgi:hypothetical protein
MQKCSPYSKSNEEKVQESTQYSHNFPYFYRWSRHFGEKWIFFSSTAESLLKDSSAFLTPAICKAQRRREKLKYLLGFLYLKLLSLHNNVTGIQRQILSVDDRKPIFSLSKLFFFGGCFYVESSSSFLHNNLFVSPLPPHSTNLSTATHSRDLAHFFSFSIVVHFSVCIPSIIIFSFTLKRHSHTELSGKIALLILISLTNI